MIDDKHIQLLENIIRQSALGTLSETDALVRLGTIIGLLANERDVLAKMVANNNEVAPERVIEIVRVVLNDAGWDSF
jgi:hypothetical protein